MVPAGQGLRPRLMHRLTPFVKPLAGPDQRASAAHRAVTALLTGLVLSALAAPPARAAASLDELVAWVAPDGTIRVLVEVRAAGLAPPSGEAIARAQDLVLREVAGAPHSGIRRPTTVPFLGVEVSAESLRRPGASSHVAGLRVDMILRPQGGTGSS